MKKTYLKKINYDVIVIGGGPAGIVSALTARNYYPKKSILLIRNIEKAVIPCGIPYMFSSLDDPDDNKMGYDSVEKANIGLKTCEVAEINKEKMTIKTKDNEVIRYKKLVLATGSRPIVPKIEGVEKDGVFTIRKEMEYLKEMKKRIQKASDILIIGGGFIGVEFADELSLLKKKVTLVEFMPRILFNSFDEEFAGLAGEELTKKNVRIITDKKVMKINGSKSVESVTLSDNTIIPCQAVVLGIGALPNTNLAKDAGLRIGTSGGILVDEYMRVIGDEGVFAVGDCAEKKDFFTRKRMPVMLASTSTAEARVAGSNLFKIKVIRENKGTIAVYSTKIGNLVLGSAGLTEQTAKSEMFDIVIGKAECIDKHPTALKNANKINIKLIFSKESRLLLGGQVSGGDSAGEIINIIGLALQKGMAMTEMETLQFATHPKLTPAPTIYPLINAAQDAFIHYFREGR